ncbi:S8 family serine peptidase [Oharaeibacter diazotrophicus]|uniref:Peptidase inhibitor I9 n=1 Tax=Oharaeibacter diazotrophicus TaxID=1920512 RepID=A0A4R6RLT0_9HYPH|nr:S8 family serine peptidase [Oharaeibacter diazotrophicus]TDP86927.1 peptidase inhibitor I9 [Oharaeibacter diazotrophicus]BBE71130.1 minor extracellular protease vpr precursor [Pleomorphomonas sp. SM30]
MTGLRTRVALAGAALALLCAAVPAPAAETSGVYIVTLADPPAVAYAGGVAGLPATAPDAATGRTFDATSAAVFAYGRALERRQDAVIATLGRPVRTGYRFTTTVNGFTARLTAAEADRLRGAPGVVSVTPDRAARLEALRTPQVLGLTGAKGIWSRSVDGRTLTGEDVIVGVVDSGIQPENPAVFDRVDAKGFPVAAGGTKAYGAPPAKWKGRCVSEPGFSAATACNDKLIGARTFHAGFDLLDLQMAAIEYPSARDSNGHGSHTAATAAGNRNAPLFEGALSSGLAPRARIAAYKACWSYVDLSVITGATSTCIISDVVAAIEQATEDGVDVVNVSIGGYGDTITDPLSLAFLGATRAGVFAAASAGNDGENGTVGHQAPWVTTVAATTYKGSPKATITLGNGTGYTGASLATAVPAAPFVLADAIAGAGVDPAVAIFCGPGTLDATEAAGKIVVCDRGGGLARVDKSAEVARAGGAGMVLVNVSPDADNLVADLHAVPTVHLPVADRTALRDYAATSGPTAAIGQFAFVAGTPAPVLADYSSAGPGNGRPEVLKPDVSAPGSDVIDAYAYKPASRAEHDAILAGAVAPAAYNVLSGTSMASPHVAGLAALIRQARPDFGPLDIRSAIMTSATNVVSLGGARDRRVDRAGAGFIDPAGALDPGLVYPVSSADLDGYLCGVGLPPSVCGSGRATAPERLNQPSVRMTMVGSGRFVRKVKNVGKTTATYTASLDLRGFAGKVTPASLTLKPGATGAFTVDLTATTAPYGTAVPGYLTWTDGTHRVRSPLLLTTVGMKATDVASTQATTTVERTVRFGYAGKVTVVAMGLGPRQTARGTVNGHFTGQGAGGSECYRIAAGTSHRDFAIARIGSLVRVRVAPVDPNTTADLDLYVHDGDLGYYEAATKDNSTETLDYLAQKAFTRVCVVARNGDGATPYTISLWEATAKPATGALVVSGLPRTVVAGLDYELSIGWSGLAAGSSDFGGVLFYRGTPSNENLLGSIAVTVRPPKSSGSSTLAAVH